MDGEPLGGNCPDDPSWPSPKQGLAEGVATGRDRQGKEFTDGSFVLYGDPALEARVEKAREPVPTEKLDIRETGDEGVVRVTYRVRVNFVGEGNKRTAERYEGWRIFSYLLPCQVTDVKVDETGFSKVVVPGETMIWDAGNGLRIGDERGIMFTARRSSYCAGVASLDRGGAREGWSVPSALQIMRSEATSRIGGTHRSTRSSASGVGGRMQ